jgi:hypothetical protein
MQKNFFLYKKKQKKILFLCCDQTPATFFIIILFDWLAKRKDARFYTLFVFAFSSFESVFSSCLYSNNATVFFLWRQRKTTHNEDI